MNKQQTATVISMCSKSHSEVWKLTSELLPQFIDANHFIVYVPKNEIEYFENITNKSIEIKAQEELSKNFYDLVETASKKADNSERFGWYLQQFYKIEALKSSESDIVAIWDADCVPVKKIELANSRGQIVYVNSSNEFHKPYFDNIKKLLNLERIQEICFVIPGFPMKKKWIDDFVSFVEEKHQIPWFEAIISCTDFSQRSGFSETETLGTWVANRYPGNWYSRKGKWERFGQSRFGFARNFDTKELINIGNKKNLEIISFENWDLSKATRLKNMFKNIRMEASR
jgi:hypothetical protein